MSIFTTYETYFKIAVILIYTGFIWYCHGVYDNSKLATIEAKQITKAQSGETNLVKFHQQVQYVYVKSKEPCLSKPMPDDVRKLLQ